MTITDKHALHNYTSARSFKSDPINAPFIPDWYYKRILLPSGSADFVGIHILAELVALRQVYGTDEADFELRSCFIHFWEKFCIKRPRIQRASARLETSGLVTRLFYNNAKIYGRRFSKELALKLNSTELDLLIAKEVSVL